MKVFIVCNEVYDNGGIEGYLFNIMYLVIVLEENGCYVMDC